MSQTYTDKKTGKLIEINFAGNEYLGRISTGLWDQLGFAPRTKEDCKLVARIMKNHIQYQKYSETTLSYFKIKRLDPEDIEWLKKIADLNGIPVMPFGEFIK